MGNWTVIAPVSLNPEKEIKEAKEIKEVIEVQKAA